MHDITQLCFACVKLATTCCTFSNNSQYSCENTDCIIFSCNENADFLEQSTLHGLADVDHGRYCIGLGKWFLYYCIGLDNNFPSINLPSIPPGRLLLRLSSDALGGLLMLTNKWRHRRCTSQRILHVCLVLHSSPIRKW